MNSTLLNDILDIAVKADIPICFWGVSGAGKTASIKNYVKNNNYGLIVLNLQSEDPLALGGLPHDENGVMKYSKPWWVFKAEELANEKKYVILFLDEMNRPSDNLILNMILSLIAEKRIREHVLPDNVRIVAACNYQDQTVELSSALVERFAHILYDSSDNDDLRFIPSEEVKDFLMNNREMRLMRNSEYEEIKKKISFNYRKWDFVSRVVNVYNSSDHKNESALNTLVMGLLPADIASVFLMYLKNYQKSLTVDDIIKGSKKFFEEAKKEDRSKIMAAISKEDDVKLLEKCAYKILDYTENGTIPPMGEIVSAILRKIEQKDKKTVIKIVNDIIKNYKKTKIS